MTASKPGISSDLLLRYLKKRREDVILCEAACQSKDLRTIQNIGHQLKGNGATFGYPDLSLIGEALEHSCVLRDWAEIGTQVGVFADWVLRQLPTKG